MESNNRVTRENCEANGETFHPTSLPDVVLTDFRSTDAPVMVDYLKNPIIHRNLRLLPNPYTHDCAVGFIQLSQDLKKKNGNRATIFAIRNAENGELIGSCGFEFNGSDMATTNRAEYPYKAELGYWLGEKYWGRGIGTAIVGALTHIAFEVYELERLEAAIFSFNTASERVLVKNQFKFEGVLRHYYKKSDQFYDAKLYSKLRED